MADSISGLIDEQYNNLSTKTTESGQTVKSDSVSYQERYTFLIDKTIFPKLTFDATGVFQKEVTNQKQTGQQEVTSTSTNVLPSATLTLKDPIYTAAIGYFLNEQQQAASRTPTVTLVNKDYQALFNWTPAGLPLFNFRYDHIDTYDLRHTTNDTASDNLTLISHYAYKGLDLRYYGTYIDTQDKLHDADTVNVTQNGTGTYNNTFFGGRLLFGTSFNVIKNEVTTSATGAGGTASVQVFPYSGLFSLTNTPTLGALSPNVALIDANLTVSAGINIGLPPPGPPQQPRDIGLDFLNPAEVNDLQVWVDRTLPATIAASFSWDIYTSSDNLTWTLVQTVFPAAFGAFQNRFDIPIAQVKTRYIKVVVNPLAATVTGASSFQDIFVTELQAFVTQTLQQSQKQRFDSTSEVTNTTVRYRILTNSLLDYESSYFLSKNSSSGLETSTLTNGLSSNYRFSSIFATSARFAWETGEQANQRENAYIYTASLIATPLPALTDSIVVSWRDETLGGKPQDTQSFFLNNAAGLYKGLDVNLNVGRISATEPDGSKLDSNTVTVGANIVPNKTMTWTFFFTDTSTDRSGAGVPSTSTLTRQATATCAYTPVRTMYLFASVQRLSETGVGVRTMQNYGFNWSPFPEGALQFRFSYNESVTPEVGQSTTIFSPGVRYKINGRSFLDLSYQSIQSKSPGLITESKGINAELRISLF
jgi:hypothetical protein